MRAAVKCMYYGLATVVIWPCVIIYRIASMCSESGRVFPGWSQLMALFPGVFGVYLRRRFYHLVLCECAPDVTIGFGTVFSDSGARLGRAVNIGNYCSLGRVSVGDDTLLASFVSIINGGGQHGFDRLDVPIRHQTGVFTDVTVGADCWIGERCVVMADVGAHSVVGAGSVVTRQIPERSVVAGSPARVLRTRIAVQD